MSLLNPRRYNTLSSRFILFLDFWWDCL